MSTVLYLNIITFWIKKTGKENEENLRFLTPRAFAEKHSFNSSYQLRFYFARFFSAFQEVIYV